MKIVNDHRINYVMQNQSKLEPINTRYTCFTCYTYYCTSCNKTFDFDLRILNTKTCGHCGSKNIITRDIKSEVACVSYEEVQYLLSEKVNEAVLGCEVLLHFNNKIIDLISRPNKCFTNCCSSDYYKLVSLIEKDFDLSIGSCGLNNEDITYIILAAYTAPPSIKVQFHVPKLDISFNQSYELDKSNFKIKPTGKYL